MQPNNNVQNPVPEGPKLETAVKEVVEMENKPVAAEPVKNDISFTDKPKKNNGMIYGMILLAILAIGGIGFGVWAMMDGNAQKDALNSQISALKAQNNELSNKVTELEDTISNLTSTNEGTNDGSNVTLPSWGEVKAEIVDGVFYIKTQNGETVKQDDTAIYAEIVSCDSGTAEAPSPLKCSVTTTEGSGAFVYNFEDGSLTYIADAQ